MAGSYVLTARAKGLYFRGRPTRARVRPAGMEENLVRKVKSRSADDLDESDVFSDQAFDLPEFVGSMEKEDRRKGRDRSEFRLSRRRIEDWQESRLLREQLQDWDDWDEDSSGR